MLIWVGLDWVRILEKIWIGLDWIRSEIDWIGLSWIKKIGPMSNSALIAMRCVTDVDECAVDNGGCDQHANCTNSYGSFTCDCIEGYLGDGFNCSGRLTLLLEIFDQPS